jgi:hypothetical protein
MRLLDRVANHQVTVRALRPDEVPEPIRSAGGLERVDYADIATLRTTGAARWTPEQWTRAIVERGSVVRVVGPVVWRGIVGLRLGSRAAPDHVAGWRLGARGDDCIRLEASSWHLTVQVVVHVADDDVSLSLLVRYEHPAAAYLWPPVSLLHRAGIPVLLRQAEQLRTGDDRTGK